MVEEDSGEGDASGRDHDGSGAIVRPESPEAAEDPIRRLLLLSRAHLRLDLAETLLHRLPLGFPLGAGSRRGDLRSGRGRMGRGGGRWEGDFGRARDEATGQRGESR